VLRASELVALYQYVKPVFEVDGYKALLVQYPRHLTPQDEVRHFASLIVCPFRIFFICVAMLLCQNICDRGVELNLL
jgi:hypothetical protein